MAAKPKSDPLIAPDAVMIDGVSFARGTEIVGVPDDQIDIAVRLGAVMRQSAFDALVGLSSTSPADGSEGGDA